MIKERQKRFLALYEPNHDRFERFCRARVYGRMEYQDLINESLLIASLARTTCYGNCPYYEVKLYSNGMALYHGKKNVEYIGLYKAKVGEKFIAEVIARAKEINYMDLGGKYPVKGLGIIDFPVCITSVIIGGEKKIIYNRNDSPQKLVEYEAFFDELLEEVQWKKVSIN